MSTSSSTSFDRSHFVFQCIQRLSAAALDLNRKDSTKPPDTLQYFISTLVAFSFYPFVYGIRGIYVSKEGLFPPNCDMGKLTINQSYLFTAFASSPPHEPTGGLTAARFLPQINTAFEKNSGYKSNVFPRYEVKAIRFDYRIHLVL